MSIAFIGETVPYSHRQTTLARLMTGAILGSIAGFAFSGTLAHYIDWRLVFAALALGLAAVTCGLWWHLPKLAAHARPKGGFLVNPLQQVCAHSPPAYGRAWCWSPWRSKAPSSASSPSSACCWPRSTGTTLSASAPCSVASGSAA